MYTLALHLAPTTRLRQLQLLLPAYGGYFINASHYAEAAKTWEYLTVEVGFEYADDMTAFSAEWDRMNTPIVEKVRPKLSWLKRLWKKFT